MRKILYLTLLLSMLCPSITMSKTRDSEAADLIKDVVAKIEPALKEYSLASWKATTTGKKEWYKRYGDEEIAFRKILSDKKTFEKIKELKKAKIADPLLNRQIDLIYLDYLENQINPSLNEELVRMGRSLEEKFNTFRAKIDGVETTDNEIRVTLKKSKNLAEREKTWEASKQIGALVAPDLIALVKKRNKAARDLGFKNFYVMYLELGEQNENELFGLLDKLAQLTKGPFKDLKEEVDEALAKRYGIKISELKPWHYEDVFFQEAPEVYNVDLDKYFKGKDVVKLVKDYYSGMGLPIDDVLARSDLFERKGKEQHAFCTHIDRKGDIRILANVKSDERWTSTMLHESGHAAYEKYFAKDLPYVLREPSHIFTTEAIAELFGRLTNDASWLKGTLDKNKKSEFESIRPNLEKALRANALFFARWVEVMTHFERALYSDPDQDLNKLWWNLVEKYQLVKKPAGRNNPDWAAKIHFSTAPVYYHNYLLGELLASQLLHYIDKNIAKKDEAFINNKKTGEYLKEKVFAPGDRLRWDDHIKYATGEKLTPKYFAEEFIK